ncbi:MAG: hypothetical protein GY797_37825 [Deltaproteobacteria bacterium]|nr:hypothetical protein [Deltaproteobacteria bacterium]
MYGSEIADAKQDPGHPIPVVLNLSSWGQEKRPLNDWLEDEIFLQYQVSRKLSQEWIQENQWLYLLDGLDEVAESARVDCVTAINLFK